MNREQELQRRREAVNFNRMAAEHEGMPVVPELDALEAAYVAGEINDEEFTRRGLELAHSLASSE